MSAGNSADSTIATSAVSSCDVFATREANCHATAVVQVSARPTKIDLARLRTAGDAPRVMVKASRPRSIANSIASSTAEVSDAVSDMRGSAIATCRHATTAQPTAYSGTRTRRRAQRGRTSGKSANRCTDKGPSSGYESQTRVKR